MQRGAAWVYPLPPFFLLPVCVKSHNSFRTRVPTSHNSFLILPLPLLLPRGDIGNPSLRQKHPGIPDSSSLPCPSSLATGQASTVVCLGYIFTDLFLNTYIHLYPQGSGGMLTWEVILGNSCRGAGKWKRKLRLWLSKTVTPHIYSVTQALLTTCWWSS